MMNPIRRLNAYDPAWLPIAVVLLACVLWSRCARQYVRVWENDLTLWRHAARVAPNKPRALINYAVELLRQQPADAARAGVLLRRAKAAAQLPHVRPFDRNDALRAIELNLLLADLIRAMS